MFGRGRGRGGAAAPSDNKFDDQKSNNDNFGNQRDNSTRGSARGGFSARNNEDGDQQNNRDSFNNQRGGNSTRGSARGGFSARNNEDDDQQNSRDNFNQRGGGRENSRGTFSDRNNDESNFNSRRGSGFDGGFGSRQGGFTRNNYDNEDGDQQNNRDNFNQQRGGGRGNSRGTFSDRNNDESNFNSRRGSGFDGGFGSRQGGLARNNYDNENGDQQNSRDNFNQQRGGGRGNSRGTFSDRNNDRFDQQDRDNFSQRGGGRGAANSTRGAFSDHNNDENGFNSRRGGFDGGFGSRQGGFGNDRSSRGGCYNCGGDGHMSRDCTEPRQPRDFGNDRPSRACYNCGGDGHMSRDCTEPRQPRGGMSSDFSDRQPYENRGFGGAGRGGSSSFRPQFADDSEVIRRPSFIPKIREVDEIFKDDENADAANDEFYQQDMEVTVENNSEEPRIFETWQDSGLNPQILQNIQRSRYSKPRQFQKYCIPLIIDGHDVKGQAETGSGKSAAFLLPIINQLMSSFSENPDDTRRLKVSALIIEPTRELAKQLYEQAIKFAHNTGVTANFAYGEYNMGVNKRALHEKGCDILIGTPGRLKGLLKEGFLKVDKLEYLVLDEADRLLDFNFMDDIIEMTKVPGFSSVEERQTLFFSATFNQEASRYANELCKKNSILVRNANTGVSQRVEQKFLHVPINDRKQVLLKLLREEMEANNGALPKKLVFVETKRDADYIATMLSDEGIKAQTVNGDRTQDLREEATEGFRKGNYLVLVVTNVFARGMNFVDLGQVINMYLPTDRDTYVHRIGRTGRLHSGVATSFFDPDHQPDRDFSNILIEELERANLEVPDFIRGANNPFGYGGGQENGYGQQSYGCGYDQSRNDEANDISAPEF